jgi:DNA polymerase III delta subunit
MLDLYRARAAINSGKTAQDVKDDFNYPKNVQFKVDNAFRDVSRMSVAHLRECMKILTETDVAMKSLKTDKQIFLRKQ